MFDGELIERLAHYEEAIGRLYRAFGDRYCEYKNFWQTIAEQETGHSEMVRELGRMAQGGEIRMTDRFKTAAVDTALKFVEHQIVNLKAGKISVVETFSLAVSIEDSLLENRYIDVFTGDTPAFKILRQRLLDETQKHKTDIQTAWNENR